MKMKKRIAALLMAVILPMLTVIGVITPAQTVQAAGTTFIVHYGEREDNNYDGWNLWVWEDDGEGSQVDFTAEDEFGKVAIYQCSTDPKQLGFIVRLNEWEAKDVEGDRFASVESGVVEIWLTSGVEAFETTAPEGCSSYDFTAMEEARLGAYDEEGALKLNVHYYDFSEKYENVECYAWLGENAGGGYPLSDSDEFGGVYHVGFHDYKDAATIGIKMYIDGAADATTDRYINLDKAQITDDTLDVYIVQGNPATWYSREEANMTPVITSAAFADTTKKIQIQVSKPIDTTDQEAEGSKFTVTDQDGNSYEITKAWSEELGKTGTALIIMKEPLDLKNTYTITREDYEGTEVKVGEAFSSEAFEEAYYYDGDDLGATYSSTETAFRLWAPTATEVSLNLYKTGDGDDLIKTVPMTGDVNGTWIAAVEGDQNGVYYTYSVTVDGTTNEAVDPYARTTGVNGNRGMVLNLSATNPQGFDKDSVTRPDNITDAVIYEAHVRDLTIDPSSGVSADHAGKYLGLTENGTTNSDGQATALDYMKELGITHLHLLPVYDYATVDETKLDEGQFNWGYDPKNYNVPEGSYSTDPYHGEVRVNEFKQMVAALHENDINVVMDVVYNHMFSAEDSCFQKIVPNYFFRRADGEFTNGSGCGNETATERLMVRKYIVDSVVYWAKEYHVDGFRFDLMGVLDTETMQAIRDALDEVDPNIIVYGEGWTGGDSGLLEAERYVKTHASQVEGIAMFSDDIRDTIKGSVFEAEEQGFVSGAAGLENALKFSIVGATENSQVDYDAYEKTEGAWAASPEQTVNYVSCHDNYSLWDKLAVSNADDSEQDRKSMNKLASAIVFTSQGTPLIQAGEEILRSKPIAGEEGVFSENSYNLDDYTNSIKWDTIGENQDIHDYYQGLMEFRAAHSALRMTSTKDVQDNLKFLDTKADNVVAYTIDNSPNGESAESIMVAFNGNKEPITLKLPTSGKWSVYIDGEKAGCEVLETVKGKVTVEAISAVVLIKEGGMSNPVKAVLAGVAAIGVALVAVLGFRARRRKK